MTSRRQTLFAGALIALAPVAAFGQAARKLPVVVYVFASVPTSEMTGADPKGPHPRALVHRLRDLGWEDGRNFVLERHGRLPLVNLKTAKSLGIAIPRSVLARADEVIE